MKAVTERLQRLRFNRKRITQRELAHRAGIPLSRYWDMEQGYRPIEPEDAKKIARELKCPVEEVLGTSETESVAS